MLYKMSDFVDTHYGHPSAKGSDLGVPHGYDYCGDFFHGEHKLEMPDGKVYNLHPGKGGRKWRDAANKADCVVTFREFVAFNYATEKYIVIRILNK